jgi:hypothetical protein
VRPNRGSLQARIVGLKPDLQVMHPAVAVRLGFLDVADAGEVGVELFEAAVTVFAEQDEDQVEQVLESCLIQQRLDVRTLVVRGDE